MNPSRMLVPVLNMSRHKEAMSRDSTVMKTVTGTLAAEVVREVPAEGGQVTVPLK